MRDTSASSPPGGLALSTILWFWLPLAATWLMMSAEGPYVAAIIARMPEAALSISEGLSTAMQEALVNGRLDINTGLSRDFPLGSYVSTALRLGEANGSLNLQARVESLFDQETWTSVWSDQRIGNQADASFNDVDYPLVVTNSDAITERWVIEFTSATAFKVIGENVGQIATGSTNLATAPLNPRTGQPYFTIPAGGWGSGWAAGNALRFNTVGGLAPLWLVLTVLAGAPEAVNDSFRLQVIGNVAGS
jgi:hypothetical protein